MSITIAKILYGMILGILLLHFALVNGVVDTIEIVEAELKHLQAISCSCYAELV